MQFEREKKYDHPEQLRKERKARIDAAIRHKEKPDRVPILSHAWTWKACDAGYNLEEYFYNYEKRFDAVCQHHEKYEMDFYMDLGLRNSFPIADCFGESCYQISEDKLHFSRKDSTSMDEDDYDTIFKDGLLKFKFERSIPYRHGITNKQQMQSAYQNAAKQYPPMVAYNKAIHDQFINKYGALCCNKVFMPFPMDSMVSTWRGMVGTSIDIRRQPENVDRFLKMLFEEGWPAVKATIDTYDPSDPADGYAVPLRLTSLAHTFLNKKQFGRFSWPYIQIMLKILEEKDWTGILYLEGSIQHIIEYLQEIPEGRIAILIEKEDPIALKKQLPNVTIIGGYPSQLLYTGTKQQCIDRAKKIIDEAAYDGQYIFSTDLMLSYPEDAKGENMKAVIEFVKEYGKF